MSSVSKEQRARRARKDDHRAHLERQRALRSSWLAGGDSRAQDDDEEGPAEAAPPAPAAAATGRGDSGETALITGRATARNEVRELNLISRGLVTLDALPGYGSALPDTLTSLNLHCNNITSLRGLGALAQLTSLNLSSNGVEVMDAVALSPLRKLRRLDLRSNALRRVGGLAGLVSLESLNLAHNKISSLGGLCQLTPVHRLRVLDLRDNRVTALDELNRLREENAPAATFTIPSLRSIVFKAKSHSSSQRPDGNTICRQPGYIAAVCQLAPGIEAIDGATREEAEAAHNASTFEEGAVAQPTHIEQERRLLQRTAAADDAADDVIDHRDRFSATRQGNSAQRRVRSNRTNPTVSAHDVSTGKSSSIKAGGGGGNPWSSSSGEARRRNKPSAAPNNKKVSRLDELATPAIDRARRMRLQRSRASNVHDKTKAATTSKSGRRRQRQEDIVTTSARRRQDVATMLTEQAKQISSLVAALKQSKATEARLKLRLRALKPSTVEAAAQEAATSLREAKADAREARGLLAKREAEILEARLRMEEGARAHAAGEATATMARNELEESRMMFEAERSTWLQEQARLEADMRVAVQSAKEAADHRVLEAQSVASAAEERMRQSVALAESESTRAAAAVAGLDEARGRVTRLENAHESLQKEMRDAVQVGAVRAAKFESMQTIHENDLGRLEAEKRHAEALATHAAEELQAATQDGVRLRAVLQGKVSEVEQTEQRFRAAESDRDRLIAKVRKMEETLAQATIAAKRGAELRVAAAEAKEKEAVAKLDGLREELETRTNQVSAMEKRAGDGALNFERVKAAYEEVCVERSQLRAALEAASDVVRRQKELVRRQAGEVVSTKRDAAATKTEVEAAMVAQAQEAQAREDTLREELRVAVMEEENAQKRSAAARKEAQKESAKASEEALAELRRLHAVAIERVVASTTATVEQQCGREIAELKRLLAQARERIVESNSLRETVQSAEKIKAAMLEDKEDTIRDLKNSLAEAEKRSLKLDGYRDRRDQLKRDLRDAEDREAEMGEKLIDAEEKLRVANESFDSIRGHLEAIIDEQAEELRQHARTASDEGGLLRAELSKKDSVIASIEDQVAAVSAAFEVRIKKSEERASQLNAELSQLRSTREEERSDALSKVQGVRTELDEIRDRHQAASALVRSLKAEQIRLERAAKDAELRANESDARFRKATARVGVLEDELAWHSQEKARIATQAQKMSRLFSEMANGGARGGGSAGGESVAKGRSP